MYDLDKRPKIFGRTYGLGGRDYSVKDATAVCEEVSRVAETGKIETLLKYITL